MNWSGKVVESCLASKHQTRSPSNYSPGRSRVRCRRSWGVAATRLATPAQMVGSRAISRRKNAANDLATAGSLSTVVNNAAGSCLATASAAARTGSRVPARSILAIIVARKCGSVDAVAARVAVNAAVAIGVAPLCCDEARGGGVTVRVTAGFFVTFLVALFVFLREADRVMVRLVVVVFVGSFYFYEGRARVPAFCACFDVGANLLFLVSQRLVELAGLGFRFQG